ncbi:hypothetical protein ID866_4423 [Astraeus odoratus]|nr:hypothetical protein ID866_4423 [Astraeus odoratus]
MTERSARRYLVYDGDHPEGNTRGVLCSCKHHAAAPGGDEDESAGEEGGTLGSVSGACHALPCTDHLALDESGATGGEAGLSPIGVKMSRSI